MDTSLAGAIQRFIDHCRIAKRLAPNTLRAYESDLGDFLAFVGQAAAIAEIDRECLRRYARSLFDMQGLKESTVKRRVAALKVIFRWLEHDEAIALSPFHRLDMPIRLPRRLPRALAVEEIRKLLAAAEAGLSECDHTRALMEFVVVCLVVTGLRVGELVSVDMAEVDLPSGSILVRGKGNRERRVFLAGSHAAAALRRYLRARSRTKTTSTRLLVAPDGMEVTAQHLRRRVSQLAKAAGLERHVTPHMLRHTAATQLIEAGIDIRFVQKLLGHASIATTQIYTQVNDTSLRAMIERADTIGRLKKVR